MLLRRPLLSSLLRCESGVTAVEFAMVVPVCLLLTCGTLEFSLIMFTSSVMEGATSNASRMGKTGYTETGISRTNYIKQMVSDRTSGLLDSNSLVVDTLIYDDITQIGDPEPFTDQNSNQIHDSNEPYDDVNGNGQWDDDMGVAGLGGANAIVVYSVSYPWPVMTPIMSQLIGNNGIYNITAHAVVKNEPYDTGT